MATLTEKDLQAAIAFHAASQSVMDLRGLRFVISNHVFLYGSFDWIGGEFEITGKTTHGWAVIHCGTTGPGTNGVAWTGSIKEAKFRVTKLKDNWARIINIHKCNGVQVSNCEFDLTETDGIFGPVSAMNNAFFCRRPSRQGITYRGNRIEASQGVRGSEGMSCSGADNVVITDNTIIGMGDDPIALHDVQGFLIENNITEATDGRIYVSGSANGRIAKNSHRHTLDTVGSLLHLERERDYQRSHPMNIAIVDNTLYHSDGSQATYGIRVRGGDGISLIGNLVISPSDNKGGIRIEPQNGPEAAEYPDGVIPVRKTTIIGNVCRDIREYAIGSARHNLGPMVAYGNACDVLQLLSPREKTQ